ncbi:unnamed protein product [Strongylus vulgaris]|uniref:Uncharacterized protein n=1 Tax=Strongylus vulgaris TaxID=40348 RepID=A0A3P7J3H2_STRVU|nr:unnamed protein product [Strongylus vulgaris]
MAAPRQLMRKGVVEKALHKRLYNAASIKCMRERIRRSINTEDAILDIPKTRRIDKCLQKCTSSSRTNFRINYNLGLVHQAMGLHCSALHFLKAASELKRDDAQIIGAMAGDEIEYLISVVLSNMNDINNARRAYQKFSTMQSLNIGKKTEMLLGMRLHISKLFLPWQEDDLLSKADQLDDALLSLPQDEEAS